MRILDLGCGNNKTVGAIGLDKNFNPGVNIIADFERYGLPFKDNTFDIIVIAHIIEHVSDTEKFLQEIHRVAKPHSIIKGTTPHFSSPYSYGDYDHKHHFGVIFIKRLSMFFPCDGVAKHSVFKIRKLTLFFAKIHRLLGIQYVANNFLGIYEFYLSGIFRARDMYFELEVIK